MSTIIVTYPVSRRLFEEFTLHCPKCHKPMVVFELWKERWRKKDRYEGACAECQNGCTIEREGKVEKLMFYAYDTAHLKKEVQGWEKDKIIAEAHKNTNCDCRACNRIKILEGKI